MVYIFYPILFGIGGGIVWIAATMIVALTNAICGLDREDEQKERLRNAERRDDQEEIELAEWSLNETQKYKKYKFTAWFIILGWFMLYFSGLI